MMFGVLTWLHSQDRCVVVERRIDPVRRRLDTVDRRILTESVALPVSRTACQSVMLPAWATCHTLPHRPWDTAYTASLPRGQPVVQASKQSANMAFVFCAIPGEVFFVGQVVCT